MPEHLIHPEHKPEKKDLVEHEPIKPEKMDYKDIEKVEKIDVEKLQSDVEAHALSSKNVSVGEKHQDDRLSPLIAQKELKADAYNRTLRKIHSRQNPLERGFSKVVHHKVIDATSEFSGKTIARPSGLLGGGFLALIGSGLLLYISKHYGFEYNFTIFMLLFAAGFLLGLLAEFTLKTLKKKSS